MVDQRPGPLGLCPVRGMVEVVQDSNIWLANTGSQPIQIDKDEVVALAECVLAEPGASAGSERPRTLPVRNAGSCRRPWQPANICLPKEKVTSDAPTLFSTRSTRATSPPSSNESGVNGNWLRTCWPSASSKRATARGVVQLS